MPPMAPTLIESTRAIGYSIEAAVADIIDNSVAADAEKIDILHFPYPEPFIAILDDGKGMNADELTAAMQYGSQDPLTERAKEDLGRFGLGLKTASLSQCRVLTVASKSDDHIEARQWDIDYVKKSGTWSLKVLISTEEIDKLPYISELKKLKHGTLVIWQKLDRMKLGTKDFDKSMGRQMDKVRDHLSLVFHRYLTGEQGIKKISISINGTEIVPADPFLVKKSDKPMPEETYVIYNQQIKVQPYILPHVSKMTNAEIQTVGGKDGLRKLQGFYVYRNKRLLVWGTWFGMMRKGELSKLTRIRVDIPNTLDELWTLDIKKSSAIPPEEVRENLQNLIIKMGERSKVKFTFRGKKETSDKEVHLWNRMKDREGTHYEINREHPMVAQLYKTLGNNSCMLDSVLTQIERTLPLNQLYVDLTSDEHIANDNVQNKNEIENAVRSMLSGFQTSEEKLNFINVISTVELYRNYPDVMEKLRKELDNHE